MTKPPEFSRGAENSKVMSLAAPSLTLRIATSSSGKSS